MELKEMYGHRLRELRLEQGYTMEQVGGKIGIKKSSYASYESKYRQPPLDKLKSLALLYGVSVDYIIGLTDERNDDETVKVRVGKMFKDRGIHWDGMELNEEVLGMLERLLDELVERRKEINNLYQIEG